MRRRATGGCVFGARDAGASRGALPRDAQRAHRPARGSRARARACRAFLRGRTDIEPRAARGLCRGAQAASRAGRARYGLGARPSRRAFGRPGHHGGDGKRPAARLLRARRCHSPLRAHLFLRRGAAPRGRPHRLASGQARRRAKPHRECAPTGRPSCERGHPTHLHGGHRLDHTQVPQAGFHPRRARGAGHAFAWYGAAFVLGGARAQKHRRLRRHGRRQDHAAQCALARDTEKRAHRHYRGLRRAALRRASGRGAHGGAHGKRRGTRRGDHQRPRHQRLAPAPRPHRGGRVSRRRGCRHAASHEHRPRRFAYHPARELAGRGRAAPCDDGALRSGPALRNCRVPDCLGP